MVHLDLAVGVRSGGADLAGSPLPVMADDPFAVAFRRADIGLALLAADERVSDANPAFCHFLAMEPEGILGRPLGAIIHTEDRDAHSAAFDHVLQGGSTPYDREQRYLQPDGVVVCGRTTMSAIRNNAGAVHQAVCQVVPLVAESPVRRTAAQRRRTEEVNRETAREHFQSLVSHEFRTPLTSIQGYSELLTGPMAGLAEVTEFALVIHHQAIRLSATLDGMLLLDRLRSGTLAIAPEPTDVNTAVSEMVTRFTLARPDRTVSLDLTPALPLAQADRGRLLQALGYLLANADARSPEGESITIATQRERAAVDIAVLDSGSPIVQNAPGASHDTFEVAEIERIQTGGGGLELAIVREIAHRHGGKTWVEGTAPGGCAFHLCLPSSRRAM